VRTGTVTRNYAEALRDLALSQDAVVAYGVLLDAVAGAVASEPRLEAVLASPRLTKARKKQLLRDALAGHAPKPFVGFLEAVVQRGRQGLLGEISREYEELVDRHLGRVHAGVTTAHEVDAETARAISAALARIVGQEVLPHFRTDARLLGGLIVRVGDRVLDGSLRRRLLQLRFSMLHARTGDGA
jgi:F-type H+-transporting ATPase subunit delta